MNIIDNIHTLFDDAVKKTLKKELEKFDELKSIFNSPIFIKDKINKENENFIFLN